MPPQNPADSSAEDDDGTIVIPVDEFESDGSENKWPTDPKWRIEDSSLYCAKLATQWVQHMGMYEEGLNYRLDKLPQGYVLLSRPRVQKPDVRDKFLYGHPSGSYFNSPNNFWPHFRYLATGRESRCECQLCGTKMIQHKGRPAKSEGGQVPTALKGPGGRRARRHLVLDKEGTQDVFKELVHKLQAKGSLDQEVIEMDSMDWRAERELLRQHLTKMGLQPAFIPRLGELVLWTPKLDGDEIAFNHEQGSFQTYCRRRRKFTGFPKWRAGTITQVPEETVTLQDAYEKTDKKNNVNVSGFRVETFPDPNSDDKRLSHQYKYVPLCNIRPLNYWDVFLQDYPEDDFHPSIKYALTIMSSFSLLDKYHFKGKWPDASINCRGIYLGAELLIVGDTICLMPQEDITPDTIPPTTDVMAISSIRLELNSCDADLESPFLAGIMTPYVHGKAYTRSRERAYHKDGFAPTSLTDEEVIEAFNTTRMKEYGTWYRLHDPESELRLSVDNIIGRLYESDYMEVMFGGRTLDINLESVVNGRQYGQQTDERIPDDGEWFFGDNRIESLALRTFNGFEVGPWDNTRDLRMWRANLKIIDGTAKATDYVNATRPTIYPTTGHVGATGSSFESVGKTSTLVRSALGPSGPSSRSSPAVKSHGMMSVPDSESDDGVEEFATAEELEDETSTDELAQFMMQPTFARGGTEESLGGDYKPETKRTKRN